MELFLAQNLLNEWNILFLSLFIVYILSIDRYTWIVLVILAAIGTIYVSLLSQQRFQNSTLATVVESTIFPIYDIPFPAVTICNYNRINYARVPAVINS